MDNGKTKTERIADSDGGKPRGRPHWGVEDLQPIKQEYQPGASTVYRVHDVVFYITNYLYLALVRLLKRLDDDKDIVLIVDGKERTGKSVLALQIAYFIDKTFTIDRVCFTGDEFLEAIKRCPPKGAIVLDEAMTTLFSRQAMSGGNIDIVKCLAEVGQKNLALIMVLPSFFDLDKYVAIHRALVLCHVKEVKGRRGHFDYYNHKELIKMYLIGKGFYDYNCVHPHFKGQFQNIYTVDEDGYRKKKSQSLINHFRKGNKNNPNQQRKDAVIKLHKDGLSHRKIVTKLGEVGITISKGTVGEYINEYEGTK